MVAPLKIYSGQCLRFSAPFFLISLFQKFRKSYACSVYCNTLSCNFMIFEKNANTDGFLIFVRYK